jgi:hypothetical protein
MLEKDKVEREALVVKLSFTQYLYTTEKTFLHLKWYNNRGILGKGAR